MTKKQAVAFVKSNAPGYIGGQKIVQKATDKEIACLIKMEDKIGKLYNEMVDIEQLRNNLRKAIERR